MGGRSGHVSQEDWGTIQEARNIINRRDGDLSYDRDFMDRAACSNVNPEIFFPERGEWSKVREAKRTCAKCPVWLDCLLYAIEHRASADWGTYGRLSPCARVELAHQLGIEPMSIDPVREYWGTGGWGLATMKAYRNRNEVA